MIIRKNKIIRFEYTFKSYFINVITYVDNLIFSFFRKNLLENLDRSYIKMNIEYIYIYKYYHYHRRYYFKYSSIFFHDFERTIFFQYQIFDHYFFDIFENRLYFKTKFRHFD